MRVLRLGLGDGRTIDLHPAVSIVTGLTEAERTSLRRGFSAVTTGLAPPEPGLLEAHGLLLDTSQADLDLLEVPAAPVLAVATTAEVAADLPDGSADALRTAERDLLLLAGDRWRCTQAARRSRGATSTAAVDATRAALLRARIERHRARSAEGVRTALDEVRDTTRARRPPDPQRLAAELTRIGLDSTDLGLTTDELVRLAEDWLEERRSEADWVVGAEVELAAHERPDGDRSHDAEGGVLEARAAQATEAHAGAIVRLDEHQLDIIGAHGPAPAAGDVLSHLLGRLGSHRPARLAGAAPLVLHDLLGHLDDRDVAHVLDRAAGLAGAVQLVVVDDHPAARGWAARVGIRSAAVVGPAEDGDEVRST